MTAALGHLAHQILGGAVVVVDRTGEVVAHVVGGGSADPAALCGGPEVFEGRNVEEGHGNAALDAPASFEITSIGNGGA
jgi:hypothetical protein